VTSSHLGPDPRAERCKCPEGERRTL